MPRYKGTILGFHYDVIKDNNAEFKTWAKEKLIKQIFALEIDGIEFNNNQVIQNMIKEILGII